MAGKQTPCRSKIYGVNKRKIYVKEVMEDRDAAIWIICMVSVHKGQIGIDEQFCDQVDKKYAKS